MSVVCPPIILSSSPVNLINVLKSTKTSFPETADRPVPFFEIKLLKLCHHAHVINIETETKSETCDSL